MIHKYIVHQKINEDCKIQVNCAIGEFLNWTYESLLEPSNNNSIFPLIISNKVEIIEKSPGRETNCIRKNDEVICFSDDYSIPEGFLICVTSPIGYEPKIIKLKNKPTFEKNNFNYVIPTHFEVKSNLVTNQTSVLMHVLKTAYFGVYIEFHKVKGKVKNYKNYYYDNPYDLSLNLINKELSIIEAKEIKELYPNLPNSIIEEFTEVVNELVKELKNNKDGINQFSQKNIVRFKKLMPTVIGTTSSLVTLTDSYINQGIVEQFLELLFKSFGM